MKARKELAAQSGLSYAKVARKMRTAIQIADAMKEQRITKSELAKMMGRRPSEITKWLSGNHNFTSDTLAELSYYLHTPITGVRPVFSFTYINMEYRPNITLQLPQNKVIAHINSRIRWSKYAAQNALVINHNEY